MSPRATRSNSYSGKRTRGFESPESEQITKSEKHKRPKAPKMPDIERNVGQEILARMESWTPAIQSIPKIQENIADIQQSMRSINAKIEEFETRIKAVEQSRVTNKVEIKSLRDNLALAQQDLNTMKQSTLASNFVLQGLPLNVANDEAFGVLKEFCSKYDQEIRETDVTRIFACKNKKKTESVIMGTFAQRTLKQNLFAKIKTKKSAVLVQDLFPSLPLNDKTRGKYVAIRNQLTVENQSILREAYNLNQGRFKYIWEQDGDILMKKEDNLRPVKVLSQAHLKQLMMNEQSQTRTDRPRRNSNMQVN